MRDGLYIGGIFKGEHKNAASFGLAGFYQLQRQSATTSDDT
jgi:hypothetical protein